MHVLLRSLIILGFFWCSKVLAAEVSSLYETAVIAKSQSAEDRDSAIKDALTIVLNRIVAGTDSLNDRVVRAVLSAAPRYVRQYQYSLVENGLPGSSSNRTARTMRVLFDEQALLRALKVGNLKIWGETRPETLLWLVIEENGQRTFFKPEAMPTVDAAVKSMAKQTGLPLLLPLMDLDEQKQLSVNDVLSAYPQHLLAASERYGVVSILAGRVAKSGDCWTMDWAFYFDQTIEQWSKPCGTLNDAFLSGLKGVYNKLSSYYAVKPYALEMNVVTLKISGILGMKDRERVSRYLNSLDMVKSANWIAEDNGLARYQVNFEGNQTDLEELLGLGRVLNPQDSEISGTNELGYRLLSERFP